MAANKWQQFASNFEERNNYVVGINDIQRVQCQLRELSGLGKVLELGCGNGTYTQCLTECADKIIATDISEDMVKVTQARFSDDEKVQVEPADCCDILYADESFDTVVMVNLLHIIPEPSKALSESLRILKTGGKLIIVSFTLHGMGFLDKIKLKYRYMRMYGRKSSGSIVLTPKLAESMADSVGFKLESSMLLGQSVKAVYLTAVKGI